MGKSAVETGDGVRQAGPPGARARPRSAATGPAGAPPSHNEVRLVGRLRGGPEQRELPSGDVLVAFKVVVDRPAPNRPLPAGVRLVSVDTVPCVAWAAGVRRTASGWEDGDVVEVTGALRRRFWRVGAGAASQTEVEVLSARRLSRASRPS